MIINEMPGGVSLNPTTVTANKILNGYTAYNGDAEFLTGTALSTVSTANASMIMNGYTAYNNLGNLITGNKDIDKVGSENITISVGRRTEDPSFIIDVGIFSTLRINIPQTTIYPTLYNTSGESFNLGVKAIPAINLLLLPGQTASYDIDSNYAYMNLTYTAEGKLKIDFHSKFVTYPIFAVYTQDCSFTVSYVGSQYTPLIWSNYIAAPTTSGNRTLSFNCGFQPLYFAMVATLTGASMSSRGNNWGYVNSCIYYNNTLYVGVFVAGISSNAANVIFANANSYGITASINSTGATITIGTVGSIMFVYGSTMSYYVLAVG